MVALMITAGFFALGGIQKTKKLYYGYTVRKIHDKEFGKLKTQLTTIGVQPKSTTSKCKVEPVYSYSTKQLWCDTYQHEYIVIGNDVDRQKNFVAAAKELDTYFKQNGWAVTSNSTETFEIFIKGVTSGIDYIPGIAAVKTSGNVRCGLTVGVAYSNPNPPAVAFDLQCNSPVLAKLGSDVLLQ